MSARTHTRPHPATTGGVGSRLPWWALALPVLAFIALLALMMNPADAHAAAGAPAVTQLFQRVQELLAR
jgi:anti-sigma-K factor RskA